MLTWPPPDTVRKFIASTAAIAPGSPWEVVFPRDCFEMSHEVVEVEAIVDGVPTMVRQLAKRSLNVQVCAINIEPHAVGIMHAPMTANVQTITVNAKHVHDFSKDEPAPDDLGMPSTMWTGPAFEPGYIMGTEAPLRIAGYYLDAKDPPMVVKVTLWGVVIDDMATYEPFRGGGPCWVSE